MSLYLNTAVSGFAQAGDGLEVSFADGRKVAADMVILSIGVRPANKLAVDAGLTTRARGGVVVDEFLRSSAPEV